LKTANYNTHYRYPFGDIYCYDHYVIGKISSGVFVNNEIAKRILTDINKHYGKQKFVFVSNREFENKIDLSVYKLIDAKTMVGIAVVGTTNEQKVQAASEQSIYSGSFSYFNNLESAIAWAESFAKDVSNFKN
jgi:hypothetical protein